MSELTPDLVEEVVGVCGANASDIAEALTRGIDAKVGVSVGEAGSFDNEALPEGFDGPGLVVMMQFGDVAMAVMLPESTGHTSDWMRKPDVTGEGKLNTLAQELSMLVVPETMIAGQFGAAWVDDLSKSLTEAEVAGDAALVPLVLENDGQQSHLTMVWPCTQPAKLLPPQSIEQEQPQTSEVDTANVAPPAKPKPTSLNELPPYAKHLLKISVPVSVRLVSKRLSVNEVLELGPGAMVSFDQSCDGPLQLTVGDRVIAEGAAVKVGERFGLEIGKMTLPEEHFRTATKRA